MAARRDDGYASIKINIDDDNCKFDLTEYNAAEIDHIMDVILEVNSIREQSGQKIDGSLDKPRMSIEMKNADSGIKLCTTCSKKFTCFNRKRQCAICKKGVCKDCVHKFYKNNVLLCKSCYVNSTRYGKMGTWFNSVAKHNGRYRQSATLVVMDSILLKKKEDSKPPPEPIKKSGKGINPLSVLKTIVKTVDMIKDEIPHDGKLSFEGLGNTLNKLSHETLTIDVTDTHDLRHDATLSLEGLGNALHLPHSATLSVEGLTNSLHVPHGLQSNLRSMSKWSGSASSLISEAAESYVMSVPVTGDINMSLFYDEDCQTLLINVRQCRNIAVADLKKNRTDPYVKSYLLPDPNKLSKKKTSIKKDTINPEFNEMLTYYIGATELPSRTLSVAVWHKTHLLKFNLFLGEVHIVFSEMDLTNKEPNWYPLREKIK